jgi:Glycosyl transferases group 1
VIGIVPGQSSTWYDKVEVPWPIAASYPAFVRYLLKHRRWDIGIAPLTDNGFNSAKSYIKFLDYSALGLASVLSDIEPYRQVVRHERTGLLVPDDPEAWYRALKRLIEDPMLRDRCRQESYADLLRNYTLGSQAEYRYGFWKSVSESTVTHSESDTHSVDLLYSHPTEPEILHSAIARILDNPTQPAAQNHLPQPAHGNIVLRIADYLYLNSTCSRLLMLIPAGFRGKVREWLTT